MPETIYYNGEEVGVAGIDDPFSFKVFVCLNSNLKVCANCFKCIVCLPCCPCISAFACRYLFAEEGKELVLVHQHEAECDRVLAMALYGLYDVLLPLL